MSRAGLPLKRVEVQSLVIHLDHVPALVAALTQAARPTWRCDMGMRAVLCRAAINAPAETLGPRMFTAIRVGQRGIGLLGLRAALMTALNSPVSAAFPLSAINPAAHRDDRDDVWPGQIRQVGGIRLSMIAGRGGPQTAEPRSAWDAAGVRVVMAQRKICSPRWARTCNSSRIDCDGARPIASAMARWLRAIRRRWRHLAVNVLMDLNSYFLTGTVHLR